MRNFLGYLMLLIASYLFCVALALIIFHGFGISNAIGIGTLAWGYSCFFIAASR